MLTKLSKLAMCLMLVSAVPGCDSAFSSAPPPVDLVGAWSCVDGPITTSWVFRADKTCTHTVSVRNMRSPEGPRNGSWELNDDLSVVVKLHDNRNLPMPETRYLNVEASKNTLFENGNNQRFRRMQ